ncbi:MAG: hypothetical protein KatS3mg014_2534 [Actinomycetota bacterium]|nr:MAG: hypothetical protein KatS3mg014_2471 [Actinomycetota bacterium]GIV00919.1 MAG: hypothetical protein KatS3mg014_2534 [Actinomycetota bacterium]
MRHETWRDGRLVSAVDLPDDPAAVAAATIESRLDAAIAANAAYLQLKSPTAAQVAAQVRLLTREVQGLLRLLRQRLEATDDV